MNYLLVPTVILLASMSAGATAACTPNTQVKGERALTSVLQNNTLCARRDRDGWQEYHQPGGVLIDYKKGPGDPVDPSKSVGTWAVSDDGSRTQVTYDYGSGQIHKYTVHTNGRGYSFCGSEGEILVTFRSGQRRC